MQRSWLDGGWDEPCELERPVATLEWPHVGRLRASAGIELEWRPEPDASERDMAVVSGGLGLALLLAQRGRIVMHGAAAVSPSGEGVCLVGASGAGKSSFMAELLSRGFRLISDGMTVVDVDASGRCLALAGPPQLRLWPDAVERMGLSPAEVLPVTPEVEKRLVPLDPARLAAATPLTQIVVLEPADEVELVKLEGAGAVVSLVREHFFAPYVGSSSASRLLSDASALAQRLPVYRLSRGRGVSRLAEASALIAR